MPKYMATPLLVIYLGISPVMVSAAMTFFLLWDAITDPLMGSFSDNFRSRFGRRRPFIVIGALLSAIILPGLFLFDRDWTHQTILIYFVLAGMLFYTADTIFNMPYQSLLLEMTADYNERTSISAYRGVLGKATTLVFSWLWAFTQLPIFANPVSGEADTLVGARWASLLAAFILISFCMLPGIFCKERYYKVAAAQKREPIFQGLKKTLSCRPFLILIGIIVLLMVTQSSVNGFAIYLINYHVFGGDSTKASFLIGMGGTVSNIIGIALVPFVVILARRTSKENVLWIILASKAALSVSLWFCYNPEYPWLAIIPPIIGVPLTSGMFILVPAMLADVVDYDEMKTSERREGTFSAIFSWNFKAAVTISAAIAGPLLVACGFDASLDMQAEATLFKMRLLLVSLPIAGLIASVWLLRIYPITPKSAHDTRVILEARRGEVSIE